MYNQWIGFNIVNNSGSFIKISNAYLSVGKFYRWDDKDNEISSDSVINTRILPGVQDLSFGSCGRSDAPVGTEGEISFEADGKVVAKS
ncbi:Asp-hemolysin precursor [Aspergillus flavus]|nr:Asp-hemolysin precursor [Aspergillus flavus]